MNFRAVMENQQCMEEFLNIILIISKLTNNCVLSIGPNKLQFIVKNDTRAGPAVWADVILQSSFAEFVFKGRKETKDLIVLTFNPSSLATAISSLRSGANYFKLNLTNNQYTCLTIEIESSNNRQISYDVPVDVMPIVDWTDLLPRLDSQHKFLKLPSNRAFLNHIDKLKNVSSEITFRASKTGKMDIVSETEMSTVTTIYDGLKTCKENTNDDFRHNSSCTVDCKSITSLFSLLQISTMRTTFGILDGVSIHIEIGDKHGMTLHSIVPAISTY